MQITKSNKLFTFTSDFDTLNQKAKEHYARIRKMLEDSDFESKWRLKQLDALKELVIDQQIEQHNQQLLKELKFSFWEAK